MQVCTYLSEFAFHLLLFWLETLVVITLNSCLKKFPYFCTETFEVAVLSVLFISIQLEIL